ncbi:hypothetical protein GW17_00006733 [Ensete ventricosum]|nr:hypothetical protein GW17_00006733 [Ensete ventricosum]
MLEKHSSAGGKVQACQCRRRAVAFFSSPKALFLVLWTLVFASVFWWRTSYVDEVGFSLQLPRVRTGPMFRPVAFILTDFGAVGDGETLNTDAFESAVSEIAKLGDAGGGQLDVPAGLWLTAPFNLTSHMTLFLAEGAVILGVELMWSRDIVISNITLRDSPFWTLHPYDCKNVTISNLTILAPVSGAPNTDGIDPDSCEDVVIENCYICTGDDGIAIKSGWDQFGIAYKRPSTNILIRNVTVRSVVSAGVSIGSEMSGGVSNVTVDNLHVWESKRGVRIKTAAGRGGYIRNISYRNVTLNHVSIGIVIKTDYNEHADEFFDPKAIPILESIHFSGIHGQNVDVPVQLNGSQEIPVRDVSFRDMSIGLSYKKKKKNIFRCSFVQGRIIGTIFPMPCLNLDIFDGRGRLVKRSVLPNKRSIGYSS